MQDNSALPEGNNVYGVIRADRGLQPVLEAVRNLVGQQHAYIYVSGYDRAESLRVSTAKCDFESTPLSENNEHLFNGGVAGSLADIAKFVEALSLCLSEARIEHQFEFYDTMHNLVQFIPPRAAESSKK